MVGIHVYYRKNSPSRKEIAATLAKMMLNETVAGDDFSETAILSSCGIGVVHHGKLRSGGLAQEEDTKILGVTGSFWIDVDSEILNTPRELLQNIDRAVSHRELAAHGPFCAAYWDRKQNMLIAEADVFGVYPLYYYHENDLFLLSGSVRSIVAAGGGEQQPNLEALGEYLSIGYIVSSRTFVKGIHQIPPGHRLILQHGKLKIEKLREFNFPRNQSLTPDFEDEIFAAFQKSIKRYVNEGQKINVSLSGGLDSRMVAAMALKSGADLAATTMGEFGSLECKVAKQVADALGIPITVHHYDGKHFVDWVESCIQLTEGRCPPNHIHFFDGMFSRNFAPGLQLHGMIGDAVLGGDFDSDLWDQPLTAEATKKACSRSTKTSIYWPREGTATYLGKALAEEIQAAPARVHEELFSSLGGTVGHSILTAYRYHFRVLGFTEPALASQALPWTDLILPFNDSRLFQLLSLMEPGAIHDRRFQYQFAMKYLPEITRIPRVKDGVEISMTKYDEKNYIDGYKKLLKKREINYYLTRLSRGRINPAFTYTYPFYDRWYRIWPEIRSFTSEILLGEKSLSRGLWDRQGLQKLLKDLKIGYNVWGAVASLLFIELFFENI